MSPAQVRSSRAAQGGSGFAPVTHMVISRDGASSSLRQPVPLLFPEGAFKER